MIESKIINVTIIRFNIIRGWCFYKQKRIYDNTKNKVAQCEARTRDPGIKSPMLYRLS